MRYAIEMSNEFERQYRHLLRSGRPKLVKKLDRIIELLASDEILPSSAHNHKLSGIFEGYCECHIEPDWLLIYTVERGKLILALVATGTHSQLFN